MDRWELLRDIGTWGAGIALLFWEAHLQVPNEYVVGGAVVLIAPRIYKHVRAVLPGHTGGPSSPESRPPRSSGSSGQEGTDD